MNRYAKIAIIAAVTVFIGGIVVLGIWDAPAPDGVVETELDDSRFPR